MAGSFNLFRRYQKAALAALAIMAMLAFFVLPPVLQMGGSGAVGGDDVVVSWQGGGLRESGLQRQVLGRRALNQFLMALQAAASGSDQVQPPLPDDEKSVVDSLLMAKEAKANGLVVSDGVVNEFLGIWTGDRVRPEQIAGVIDQLRDRVGIGEQDIFDGLRTLLLGERMQALTLRGTGFAGSPPGWRWDAFRRLEQSATVEVVPVIVESLSDQVPEPTAAQLEKLYATYAGDLPQARSENPGFREPARLKYEALVAPPDLFVAEAEQAVTDEQIAAFYEANKEQRYKKPAAEPAAEAAKPAETTAPAGEAAAGNLADETTAPAGADEADEKAAPEEPAATTPNDTPPADAEPAGDATPPAADATPPAGEVRGGTGTTIRNAIRPVSFRQPSGEAQPPATQEQAPQTGPGEDAASPAAAPDEKPADPPAADGEAAEPAGKEPPPKAAEESPYQPLDEVRDEIRKQLAREAADQRVGEVFDKVAARIATYADDLELAIGLGEPIPSPPDVEKLAAQHGLQPLQSDFVDAGEAIAAGGIGSSFQLAFSQQFGVRQQQWADMLFSPEMPRWRAVVTRDFAGSRYLSWKTEDRPEFTPPLPEIRDEVERVWRLLEARPLAEQRAEELAKGAAGTSLADAVAGQDGLEATTVGPFTWLTRGTAPFGSAPVISEPEGVQMPGEALMQAVFALEPGQTAIAFNEPRTICYCIRLVSLEPAEETLRERFIDASTDPRRMAALADEETREVRGRWLDGLEKRYAVEWKREPR
jgi:hypothetical protein